MVVSIKLYYFLFSIILFPFLAGDIKSPAFLKTNQKDSVGLSLNNQSEIFMYYPNEGWKNLDYNGYYYQLKIEKIPALSSAPRPSGLHITFSFVS